MNSREVVKNILDEHGVIILNHEDNIDLDSLQLISIICAMEDSLNIQIDDSDLIIDNITFDALLEIANKYINKENV